MSLGNRLNTRNKAEREYKSQAFDLQKWKVRSSGLDIFENDNEAFGLKSQIAGCVGLEGGCKF